MVCNHLAAFSVCCYVIITESARYNEKKINVGTLWWAKFFFVLFCFFFFIFFIIFFKRLDRNGSISLNCLVRSHFVAFPVYCCVIITE